MSAMRAVRFGSYSIAANLPGPPNLSRRKAMAGVFGLEAPPRSRTVMRPCWLRPDFCLRNETRLRSGVFFVISSKVKPVMPRRPGEVGLYCFVGMVRLVLLDAPEDL